MGRGDKFKNVFIREGAVNFFYKLIKRRGPVIKQSAEMPLHGNSSYCVQLLQPGQGNKQKEKMHTSYRCCITNMVMTNAIFFLYFKFHRQKKRCHESARKQDLAPFTRELIGALSGPQTPGRKAQPSAFFRYLIFTILSFNQNQISAD